MSKLLEHQDEARQAVLAELDQADRATLVMACGSGKTRTGLAIAEALSPQRTLVLLPSLALVAQTLREYKANATIAFTALAVCSDDSVADDVHTAELPVAVSTDAVLVAATAADQANLPLVIFSTYQSSPVLVQAGIAFDLAICDEAHRIAGERDGRYATILDNDKIAARKRLFMTATPKLLTGDKKVVSMDDEELFGARAYTYSFSRAIADQRLVDYQVLVVGINDEQVCAALHSGAVTASGQDAHDVAVQYAVAKAMVEHDLHQVLTFHSRVKRAEDFAVQLPKTWDALHGDSTATLAAVAVAGEQSQAHRQGVLSELAGASGDARMVVANARCLSEGVDVPSLDAVAFVDQRTSQVDIVQAVGRAIRKSDGKTRGTVLIPVYLTDEDNPHTVMSGSKFAPVWQVLRALRANDDLLGGQLDAARRNLALGDPVERPDKVSFDLPFEIDADFEQAITVRLIESTTEDWEALYARVAQLGVVQAKQDPQLNKWVLYQRTRRRNGWITTEQVERLEALDGWIWHAPRLADDAKKLAERLREQGSSWVDIARSLNDAGYRRTDETEFTVQAVRGMVLGPAVLRDSVSQDDKWQAKYDQLLEWTQVIGALKPRNDGMEPELTKWMTRQRERYPKGLVPDDRIALLNALPGWTWQGRKTA